MPLTASKLIRVGHSPDPDDAFMFYALAKGKIPMQGFRVEHVIEDIESLNQRALVGEAHGDAPLLDVTAVSCHAYAYLADNYVVLRSGASVGDNYGPILVRRNSPLTLPSPPSGGEDKGEGVCPSNIRGKSVAVPGKLTTAYLVLQLYEDDFIPVFTPFDKILEAVLSGDADFGLLIHEGQITYQEKGLSKVLDLGKWWYEKTKLPLPLGVDVIRRDLGEETIHTFARLFKESIQYALSHRKEALAHALQYGRGISENLGDRFVGMYVNHYTVDLGREGETGFQRLLDEGAKRGLIPRRIQLEFV